MRHDIKKKESNEFPSWRNWHFAFWGLSLLGLEGLEGLAPCWSQHYRWWLRWNWHSWRSGLCLRMYSLHNGRWQLSKIYKINEIPMFTLPERIRCTVQSLTYFCLVSLVPAVLLHKLDLVLLPMQLRASHGQVWLFQRMLILNDKKQLWLRNWHQWR